MFKKFICYLLIISMIIPFPMVRAEDIKVSAVDKTPETTAVVKEYNLRTEDVIRISVWGYPELEKIVTVSPEGNIIFPPVIEKIEVSGLTVDQLEKLLVQQLSKYLKDVIKVEVNLQGYKGNRVFVLGQVLKPGQYSFAVMPNILEVITQAGGGAADASLRGVRILRGGAEKSEVILVDVDKYLQTGDISLLPILKAGDTVYVPRLGEEGKLIEERKRGETRHKNINIVGEIRGPGVYPLEDSIELIEAVSKAGGFTPYADLKKITIISYKGDLPVVNTYSINNYINNGDLSGNPIVKAGDTIIVPTYIYEGLLRPEVESKANLVYVLGEVYHPGSYQLEGNRNIWNVVQLAGGVTDEAYINKIKVIKGKNSKDYPNTLKLDLTENLDKSEFSGLPPLESGDTVIIPKKTHFWRETVRFFSEIAIIVGVVHTFNR
ncbi:MAG: SLBB domain-containing protein [bacterium]|nr:SLBB domain-containing protein [bacterium]